MPCSRSERTHAHIVSLFECCSSFCMSSLAPFLFLSVLLVDWRVERSPGEGNEQRVDAQRAGDPSLHGDQTPPFRSGERPYSWFCATRPQTTQQLKLLLWLQPGGAVTPTGWGWGYPPCFCLHHLQLMEGWNALLQITGPLHSSCERCRRSCCSFNM